MERVKIKNWYFVNKTMGPFAAPECEKVYLCGEVYGHPKFEDGHWVHSTSIQDSSGREITTKNTIYELDGPPEKDYEEFCININKKIDENNPFKILKKVTND